LSDISEAVRSILKNAAKKLSGAEKREFIAEVTLELLDGNARKAEREFGWGRETVKKGMRELKTRIRCLDNFAARGNKRTEDKLPRLADDIQEILAPNGCVNPRYFSYFKKNRPAPIVVRKILVDDFGYDEDQLPNQHTMGLVLHRLGYQFENTRICYERKGGEPAD